MIRDFAYAIFHIFGDTEFSLPQLATLLLLEDEQEPTVKQIAGYLGRSVSATSRLLDVLVERGLATRREDAQDRRIKRIAITERGHHLIASVEQARAETQLAVMEYLTEEEQAAVARAMSLLAEAGQRRKHHELAGTTPSSDQSGDNI